MKHLEQEIQRLSRLVVAGRGLLNGDGVSCQDDENVVELDRDNCGTILRIWHLLCFKVVNDMLYEF